MPSGMVSLTRLALAHADVDVLPGKVGDAADAGGVSVGENCKGVCVKMGVAETAGVAVSCAFCAATVSATAVAMDGSAVLCAPQAERMRVRVVIRIIYFLYLNIFFLSFTGNDYTVKRTAPGKPGAAFESS